jgi:hypothetical protein
LRVFVSGPHTRFLSDIVSITVTCSHLPLEANNATVVDNPELSDAGQAPARSDLDVRDLPLPGLFAHYLERLFPQAAEAVDMSSSSAILYRLRGVPTRSASSMA